MRRTLLLVCLAILLAPSAAHAQSTISFQIVGENSCPLNNTTPTACFSVGGAPLAVTTADFDGDGKVDVATANNDTGDASVLIGRGDGSFVFPAITLTVSELAAPSAIAAADFDKQHGMDLVVADEMDTVSVFLNQGVNQGVVTFSAPITTLLPTGTSPEGVATGDFNNDGNMDVAVAGSLNDTVTILLGTGDGHFTVQLFCSNQPTQTCHQDGDCSAGGTCIGISVGSGPVALVAADLDTDANHTLDLLVANEFGGPDSNGTLSVLKGDGHGNFVLQSFCSNAPTQACTQDTDCGTGNTCDPDSVLTDTLQSPVALAVGDMGNGKLDVVAVNEDGDSASVLLGNGDLTFASVGAYTVSSVPEGVALADFDGDGILDIATSGSFDDNVSVLPGLGNGVFNAEQDFAVGSAPFGIAVADLNSPPDGKPDVVTANSEDNDVSVLLNTSGQPPAACTGDCNMNGTVTVDEIITMVNIALNQLPVSNCTAGDSNMSGTITVDEIIAAVNNALMGCPNGM